MLVTTQNLLKKADKAGYAVGAFNFYNLETLQAIVNSSIKLKSPAIIQTTEGAIEYAGMNYLISLAQTAGRIKNTQFAFHLDHGKDVELIKKAINKGYTSVMIDASHYEFDKNIKVTKQIVKSAEKKGVSVEAELGTIGGAEDKVSSREILYTDPEKAKEFVEKTGCTSLAVAIGTSHGAYKFEAESHLNIELLKQINQKVKIPLVLHGASGINPNLITIANQNGAKIQNAHGVSDNDIKMAVNAGIRKINIDSDLRLSFTAGIRRAFNTNAEVFDPREYIICGRKLAEETVQAKMKLFGSINKL